MKTVKLAVLRAAGASGANAVLARSRWRRNRLLVLCYHGVSLKDEHIWRPSLYMAPSLLERRFALLREFQCSVLPLDEAVSRLYAGDLPPRSVALTFDDGAYDFHAAALPLLCRFQFPATVYLSTYYVEFNRPVFDTMCSYLLWKASGRCLDWPEILPHPIVLDQAGRDAAARDIKGAARRQQLSGAAKDCLLAGLAARLDVDYERLCRDRLLHLMNPAEVRAAAEAGIDVQLHTHRHRVYKEREPFVSEIEENRRRIEALSGRPARHFCYPSGLHLPALPGWLRDCGILSATTCHPGLCRRNSDAMLLPRYVDTSHVTETEFRAWISGLSHLLPRRHHGAPPEVTAY